MTEENRIKLMNFKNKKEEKDLSKRLRIANFFSLVTFVLTSSPVVTLVLKLFLVHVSSCIKSAECLKYLIKTIVILHLEFFALICLIPLSLVLFKKILNKLWSFIFGIKMEKKPIDELVKTNI